MAKLRAGDIVNIAGSLCLVYLDRDPPYMLRNIILTNASDTGYVGYLSGEDIEKCAKNNTAIFNIIDMLKKLT